MTCSLLNKERNPGHSGIVTGWNSGRRKKSNDWPIDRQRQNAIFLLEKFGKESSVWDRSRREKDANLSQLRGKSPLKRVKQSLEKASDRDRSLKSTCSGMSLARKKREIGIWTLNIVKDKYNLNCFPSTLPTYWKVICTQKERKKLERFCFINSELVNELCYMLQSGDLDIFSSKIKIKKRK